MLVSIVRHEWRSLVGEAALWIVVALFTMALGYGALTGVRWVQFQRNAIADTQQEEAVRFKKHEDEIARINREDATVSAFSDPRNPDAVSRSLGTRYAVLPPTPLAPLAVGQSDLLRSYFRVTTDASETVLAATELENPHRLLAGRFDLAFVLVYLYPLLIIGMTYNVLSAEKEQGTLVLALSQPVSLRTFVLAKVLTRVIIFLAVVIILTLVALAVGGVDIDAPEVLSHLMLWADAVALYGLFWFGMAALVATLGKSSASNAMMLVGGWIVCVILLPSLLSMAATSLYPMPSRVEMIQAMRVASDEANEEGSRLLARYYEDHPELASDDTQQAMNNFNMVRVAVTTEVDRRVQPVLRRYTGQLEAQQRIVAYARFLSPAILMRDILNDVAGTGTWRHREFVRQVETYHQRWRNHFVPLISQKRLLVDYSGLPQFAFEEEDIGVVARRVMISLAGLAIPTVVIAALAFLRLRRFRVDG